MRKYSAMTTARFLAVALAWVLGFGAVAALATSAAPDFALKSRSGQNVRLSEQRGQVVLINFWASWCSGCREEMPKLDELYQRYRSAGFTVLGVNVDEKRANAEKTLQSLRVSFPVLFDLPSDDAADYSKFLVARLYEVRQMPATVIVDRGGRVRYVHGGYRSGDEGEYQAKIRELLKE